MQRLTATRALPAVLALTSVTWIFAFGRRTRDESFLVAAPFGLLPAAGRSTLLGAVHKIRQALREGGVVGHV